jgi:putative ABC transport system permease protein
LQCIILIAVLLSGANSVNMSVFERTGEFGTLMALGKRSAGVFRLVLTENALLGFAGGMAGVVLGVALALLISAIGIPMPPPPNSNNGYTAVIRISAADVAEGLLMGMIATVLAAILAGRRVARVPVVEALRQN